MTPSLPVVVFDCQVFVQVLVSREGPASACYRLVTTGAVALRTSADILTEIGSVLNRPKLRRQFTKLTDERVEAFLTDLAANSLVVADIPMVFTYERDPKDEMYVNLALAARASYLVSRDKDLLDLMRVDLPEGSDFQKRFSGLRILDPAAFLDEMRTLRSQTPAPEKQADETPGKTAS